MRLFLAVMPPAVVVDHLHRRLDVVRARHSMRMPQDVRWTDPDRWHITLVFVGEVPDERAGLISPVLTDVVRHAVPPEVHLESTGLFNGKVLFAGVGAPSGGAARALQHLAVQTREVVTALGVELESRPFQPHLTLARTRERDALTAIADDMSDYVGPTWCADEVVLVESVPGPEPAYRTLTTALVGPGR